MRTVISLGLLLAFLVLPGCFRNETVLKVNPDGSGQLVVHELVSKAQIAQMEEMAKAFGGEEAPEKPFSKAKSEAKAKEFGAGVTLASYEEIEQDGFIGSKATYAFADVNKLKFDADLAGEGMKDKSPLQNMKLTFVKGENGPSRLTVVLTGEEKEEGEEDEDGEASDPLEEMGGEEALGMMKSMFAGARMSITIAPQGTITSVTGAEQKDGRVTLISMELDKLMGQAENLKKLGAMKGGDFSKDMPKIDGLTVPSSNTIEIAFE